jgi:uncharacterized RDD family membrane protein YckC
MAPEQAMGKEVDCRCDIYALGMTLYHLISGRVPFSGSNAVEVLAQQMGDTPPSLLGEVDELVPEQNQVIVRMIEKKPEDRYSTYDELLTDLHRYAPGADRLASPIKRMVAEGCNWIGFHFVFTFVLASMWLLGGQFGLTNEGRMPAVGWLMFAYWTIVAGVHVVTTARGGATPGKRLLGLCVQRLDGQRVGYVRAALRFATAFPFFVLYVPIMLLYVINDVGTTPLAGTLVRASQLVQAVVSIASLILLWFHPARRAIHDYVAGTIVLREVSKTLP